MCGAALRVLAARIALIRPEALLPDDAAAFSPPAVTGANCLRVVFGTAVVDAAAVVADNPETSMFVFSVAAFFFGFSPFNYALNWAIGRVWPFRM